MFSTIELQEKIKKNKFLIIGRAGIDIFADPPGTKIEKTNNFIAHLGGSSANISVALSKLGGNCHLLTCVSDDALGRLAINRLNHYGVNTSLIKSLSGEARISFAVIETTTKNHQSIIFRNGAADLQMNNEDINKVNFSQFSTVIITGTSLASEPSRSAIFKIFSLAKKNGLSIIFDIDYRPYTWKSLKDAANIYLQASELCDVIIGNDEEFGVMSGNYDDGLKLAKKLSNTKSSIVIYKMGAKGSISFVNKEVIKTGIFNVKALKPTGAGDAFIGAFIASLLNNKSVKESIIFGSAAAAIVVTKVGCSVAMPQLEELKLFIKNNEITNFNES